MPKLIMSNSPYWRTRLVTYNDKKGVSILIENSERILFRRYDETRAKLNTVCRLAVYDGYSVYLFDQNYLCYQR